MRNRPLNGNLVIRPHKQQFIKYQHIDTPFAHAHYARRRELYSGTVYDNHGVRSMRETIELGDYVLYIYWK